ncbi:MAG: BMP family ABC transporter substrate-binding protein [Leptotrichiaceae bacterium]
MKKIIIMLSVLATLLFVVSCGSKEAAKPAEGKTEAKASAGALKVGIVYSTGGKGDKSFNDSAFRGLERAQKELGITFSEYEPKDAGAESLNQLRQYAESGEYGLIIAVGFSMKDSLIAVAKEFPEQKFAIIDERVTDMPNVASLNFKEEEGSFLMGAVAAMMSKTNTIGFVGAIEVPLIKKFEAGFIQGAKYVKPDIKEIGIYVGGSNAFGDAAAGKAKAETLIQQKADVIYHAAGGTGLGVFQAAKEKGIYAIGVDSNQDNIAPGVILTSMMKNVDVAVFNLIKEGTGGTFKAQVYEFGIKENGVGATQFEFTKDKIGAENLKKLDEIKAKIVSGEIKVSPTK